LVLSLASPFSFFSSARVVHDVPFFFFFPLSEKIDIPDFFFLRSSVQASFSGLKVSFPVAKGDEPLVPFSPLSSFSKRGCSEFVSFFTLLLLRKLECTLSFRGSSFSLPAAERTSLSLFPSARVLLFLMDTSYQPVFQVVSFLKRGWMLQRKAFPSFPLSVLKGLSRLFSIFPPPPLRLHLRGFLGKRFFFPDCRENQMHTFFFFILGK